MLSFRPSGDYVGQMSNIAITNAIMRNKLVELLHKQLVRKGRADIEWINHPKFGKVYNVKRYDIKSPSKNPYNYDSRDDLGLNQFFMGQDPYKPYNGDPKDGIYHDKCYIRRKELEKKEVFNTDNWTYDFFQNTNLDLHMPYMIFPKKPEFEVVAKDGIYGLLSGKYTYKDYYKIINVSTENESKENIVYAITILWVEVDMYKQSISSNGSFVHTHVGKSGAYVDYSEIDKFVEFDRSNPDKIEFDLTTAGTLFEGRFTLDAVKYFPNSNQKSLTQNGYFYIKSSASPIRLKRNANVYLTGVLLKNPNYLFRISSIKYLFFSDGSTFEYLRITKAGYKLPVECFFEAHLYDSSDMPIQGSKVWLDSWNNNFRLFVKEDKETWQKIAAPVIMIVGAIVTVISAGSATGPYAAAAGILLGVSMVFTGVGMATGSKTASRWAKYTGIASAVLGVGAIISNMARTAAGYVAKSSASTLSSQGACSVNGLNTTASLYDSFAINSASQAGVSVGVGGNPALASSVSPLVSSNVTSIATASFAAKSSSLLSLAKDGFKSFNSVKKIIGAFKKSGEFRDEDMPESSSDERHDAYSSEDEDVSYSDEDVFYYKRRFYELHKEYDLGLEDGTLMSLESEVLEKV